MELIISPTAAPASGWWPHGSIAELARGCLVGACQSASAVLFGRAPVRTASKLAHPARALWCSRA
eukprot:6454608-Pyramimonas_sp.AAC.1